MIVIIIFDSKMPQFSVDERRWIVTKLLQNCTYREVQEEFFVEHGKAAPAVNNMRNMLKKFNEHGVLTNRNKEKSGRIRSARCEENIQRVKEHLEADNHSSMRSTGLQLIIPKSSVHRIAKKDLNLHPYKSQGVEPLSVLAKNRRVAFAESAPERLNPYLDDVWFSDESWIELEGFFNKQNDRTWAEKNHNPNTRVSVPKHPQKVMIWAAMNANHGLIVSILPQGNVNTEAYLEMLSNSFIPRLQELGVLDRAIFMQDGATAHTSAESIQFLIQHFNNRIISNR